jgi:5-formyltetrahydrofolate cyclo-ligase
MEILTKKQAREIFKEKRKSLQDTEVGRMSEQIRDLLFSRLMMHRYSPIHIFLPIKKHKEPDTSLIISLLRKDFAPDIYISKSEEDGTLTHYLYTKNTKLAVNKWGIAEPEKAKEGLSSKAFFEKYKNEDILIFLPLLAFDKTGNRVGYGKGFYDRFLEVANEKTTCLGISFFEPIDQISDVEDHDFRLDYCVTPKRLWQFKN